MTLNEAVNILEAAEAKLDKLRRAHNEAYNLGAPGATVPVVYSKVYDVIIRLEKIKEEVIDLEEVGKNATPEQEEAIADLRAAIGV